MPDLIDRNALLLKQKAHADLFADSTVHDDIVRRDEATAALAEIINAPSASRWIPCSERLPKIYERVLTADRDGKVTENFRCNIKTGGLEWSKGFWITHWMPLPEPPEKE